ncbi:unnamed protein product, partial [Staurois parvus]
MPRPFNTVPHVVVTPNHKIIYPVIIIHEVSFYLQYFCFNTAAFNTVAAFNRVAAFNTAAAFCTAAALHTCDWST